MKTPARKFTIVAALCAVLAIGAVIATAAPKVDVSKRKHPNLEAAQVNCVKAFNDLVAAQSANEFDMEGHASKAKNYIDQANREIKLAAEAANANGK
jgi:hypothetical protein